MAHYAEINENNIVINVIVIPDSVDTDEKEAENYCKRITGSNNNWLKTSYNNNIRKNYAGVGYFYDKDLDAFIAPKPFNSWILDENCKWIAPIQYPNDGFYYFWSENTTSWEKNENII